MVKDPEDYKWSSYSMFIDIEKEKLISSHSILDYFKDRDRKLYKNYVESGEVAKVTVTWKLEKNRKQKSYKNMVYYNYK